MKIYDCFQFFDENMMLDLRLNILNEHVHKFVIVENRFMHSGVSKDLVFDIISSYILALFANSISVYTTEEEYVIPDLRIGKPKSIYNSRIPSNYRILTEEGPPIP